MASLLTRGLQSGTVGLMFCKHRAVTSYQPPCPAEALLAQRAKNTCILEMRLHWVSGLLDWVCHIVGRAFSNFKRQESDARSYVNTHRGDSIALHLSRANVIST